MKIAKIFAGALLLAAVASAAPVAAFAQQAQTASVQPFVVGGHIEIVDGQMVAVGGQMAVDVDEALPTSVKLKKGAVLNFVRKQPIVGTKVSIKALPPKVQAFCICHTTQPANAVDPAGYHVVLAVKGDTPSFETFEITHTATTPGSQPTVETVTVEVVK